MELIYRSCIDRMQSIYLVGYAKSIRNGLFRNIYLLGNIIWW